MSSPQNEHDARFLAKSLQDRAHKTDDADLLLTATALAVLVDNISTEARDLRFAARELWSAWQELVAAEALAQQPMGQERIEVSHDRFRAALDHLRRLAGMGSAADDVRRVLARHQERRS